MENQTDIKIAVHIVAWNCMGYLPSMLETLEKQTVPHRITIVDNASNDGTINWVTGHFPQVGTLRNMRNYGFARAHNQAIALALASWQDMDLAHRYILVANADIELDDHCLARLFDFMEAHPEVDACVPKLLRAHLKFTDADNKATVRTNILDATGMCVSRSLRPYERGAGEEDKGQYDLAPDVFGASGALVLYRASSVQRVSLDQPFYDEDFFAYQEDLDVSWRMRHLGMRTAYVPQAMAWHHRRVPSLAEDSWLKAWLRRRARPGFINYLSTRNHCWALIKNLTGKELWHSLLWLVPYEILKLLASILSWSQIRGYASALVGMGKMWRKRKKFMKSIQAPFKDLSAWFM